MPDFFTALPWLVVLALLVLIGTIVWKGLVIIQQAETMVIERLGKFHRVLKSGINILIPMIDKPRPIQYRMAISDARGFKSVRPVSSDRIDLRETVYDFPRQNVITRDNVVTEINALLYFQITDPMKAVYEIANLPDAIEKLTQTTLRNVLGEMDLDETLTSRDTVNRKLRAILDEATDKWGIKINRVELQDINPPADIRDAMEKQMRAERDRRAQVLTAEGGKQALVLEAEGYKMSEIARAEGEKQARILAAQGEAEARLVQAEAEAKAIRQVADAVKDLGTDPAQYLLGSRYIDSLARMAEADGGRVVFMPYEATAALGSVGTIKELWQAGGGRPPAAPTTGGATPTY